MIKLINKDYMLHLDMFVKDCDAEFYFNDIPLRKVQQQIPFHSMNAHHLILDGMNKMEIVINPGPTPSLAKTITQETDIEQIKGSPKVLIRLMRYPVGAFAGDTESGDILMQLNWEYDAAKMPDIRFPHTTQISHRLEPLFGQWLWQGCESIDFERELPEIHRVAEAIYREFNAGNAQAIVRISEPALKDIGKALPAYGEAAFRRDMLADIAANATRAIEPEQYPQEQTDFRLCGDGKLVQLINKDWKDTIVSAPDEEGERYEFPVFLGKLQGNWWVVM